MTLSLFITAVLIGTLLRAAMMISEDTDEYVSLWLIQRQTGRPWVNYEVDDSVLHGYYGYPVLVHWAISRFPSKHQILVGRVLNIIPDLLSGVVVYCLSMRAVNTLNLSGQYRDILSLAAMLLYLTLPLLIPAHLSRMKTIKSRSWGSFFVLVYLLSSYQIVFNADIIFLLVGIISGLLCILSSMFALQVIVIFSLFLSLFYFHYGFILLIIFIFAISFSIPQLKAREPILFYIHHKWWYLRNFEKGTTAAPRKNIINTLLLPYYLIRKPRRFIYIIITTLPFTIIIISFPELIALAAIYVQHSNDFLNFSEPIYHFSFAVGFTSLIVFFIVCFRSFSFIGQAERYFEYTSPFLCVLFPYLLVKYLEPLVAFNYLMLFCLLHIAVVLFYFLIANIDQVINTHFDRDKDFLEAFEWLRNRGEEGTILTVPCKLGFRLSYLNHRAGGGKSFSFFFKFIKIPGENGFRYYEESTGGLDSDSLPSKEVLKPTPHQLKERFGAFYILISKRYLAGLRRQWGPHFESLTTLFENPGYLILKT